MMLNINLTLWHRSPEFLLAREQCHVLAEYTGGLPRQYISSTVHRPNQISTEFSRVHQRLGLALASLRQADWHLLTLCGSPWWTVYQTPQALQDNTSWSRWASAMVCCYGCEGTQKVWGCTRGTRGYQWLLRSCGGSVDLHPGGPGRPWRHCRFLMF